MMAPGTDVRVKFLHDGAERNVTVKLGELPADGGAAPRTEWRTQLQSDAGSRLQPQSGSRQLSRPSRRSRRGYDRGNPSVISAARFPA